MKRYLFQLQLSGFGKSPEEAWEDAVESFMQDPGGVEQSDILDVEDEFEDEEEEEEEDTDVSF